MKIAEMFGKGKTILSFENGKAVWSKPEPYFSQYRKIEKAANCQHIRDL